MRVSLERFGIKNNVMCNRNVIGQVQEFQYLGVKFDFKLDHVDYVLYSG